VLAKSWDKLAPMGAECSKRTSEKKPAKPLDEVENQGGWCIIVKKNQVMVSPLSLISFTLAQIL